MMRENIFVVMILVSGKKKVTYLPKKDSYIMAEPGEFDEDIE